MSNETNPPVEPPIRFYEAINLQDARGYVVQERQWSDGVVEYWTIVACPIIAGPSRGRMVNIWAQLPAADRLQAFTDYAQFINAQEESLQRQVHEQLQREDEERRQAIVMPGGRRAPKHQGPPL